MQIFHVHHVYVNPAMTRVWTQEPDDSRTLISLTTDGRNATIGTESPDGERQLRKALQDFGAEFEETSSQDIFRYLLTGDFKI
jgi:hypothetical protein